MNYGHLRSFICERALLTPVVSASISSEANNIAHFLFEEATSSRRDEVEIPCMVQEKYERMLELLPEGLTLNNTKETTIRNSFAM